MSIYDDKAIATAEANPTAANLAECLVLAHAESNKAEGTKAVYGWNRVLRTLLAVECEQKERKAAIAYLQAAAQKAEET